MLARSSGTSEASSPGSSRDSNLHQWAGSVALFKLAPPAACPSSISWPRLCVGPQEGLPHYQLFDLIWGPAGRWVIVRNGNRTANSQSEVWPVSVDCGHRKRDMNFGMNMHLFRSYPDSGDSPPRPFPESEEVPIEASSGISCRAHQRRRSTCSCRSDEHRRDAWPRHSTLWRRLGPEENQSSSLNTQWW
jgi:hypothetical protein